MQPKRFSSPILVGFFTLLTLGAAALYVTFLSQGEQAIGPHVQIQVRFRDVSGLRPGSEVKLAGFRVGSVNSITIDSTPEDGPHYLAILRIQDEEDYRKWLRTDSSITIASTNLLGDKHVEIGFGSLDTPKLTSGSTVWGKEPIQIGSILEEMTQTISHIKTISLSLRKGLAGEDGSMDNFSHLLGNLREASNHLTDISKGVSQIIGKEPAEGVDVQTLLIDLKRATSDIREITRLVRGSISGPEGQPADLHQMISNLEKTATNTSEASRELRTMLGQNDTGKPINIQQTLQNIEESAANLRDITRGLKSVLPDRWFNKK